MARAKLFVPALASTLISRKCTSLYPDFKDCLSSVYSAIEEADFLAIDGEFSGKHVRSLKNDVANVVYLTSVVRF